VDTLYSQCDKELKIDFFAILEKKNAFVRNFNAAKYIEDTQEDFFLSPEDWINSFHATTDLFVRSCVSQAQRILINKKYILFSIGNNERYYELYSNHYDSFFTNLDIHLSEQQNIINVFVANKIREFQNQEMH